MKKIFSATAWHKACIFDIQHCHVELYINPANLASGVKYGPTPGGHYRTLTLLDDFFKCTKMAEKRIHNPDKSSSADVSRVSRSHDQDGHHTHHTHIW